MQNSMVQSFLSEIPTGENVIIASLGEGNELNRRLTSLGFTPGTGVKIVQNIGRGPMIVFVRGTKIAIGRGEAAKINVQKETS
ncbi:MAG: ferrous iron transport protein A [Anaerolineaceae bacterium]